MLEVQSAGSGQAVAPVASAQECNTLRKVTLVRDSRLFTDVAPADCREIVSATRESEFLRRQPIFVEGDPIRQVILLTSGSAKVVQLGQNGTEVILRITEPGELVEMTEFPARCCHRSTAQALVASTVMIWEAGAFQALAQRFPALRRNILELVGLRLQELEERYREISTEKVATRLSRQLLRLFSQLGRRVDANDTLKINLSREELAQMTGTTLFTVSRLLSKWSDCGVLSVGRESVSVDNIQALRELAADG